MRAPPEAGTTMSGAFWRTASRAAASSAPPTVIPMDPPRKLKSSTAMTTAMPPILPWATTMASGSPVRFCASLRRSV